MKSLPFAFALALGLAFAAPSLAQKPEDKKAPAAAPAQAAGLKDVTPDEAEKLIAARKDVVVVDVRTPGEFSDGHIAGAKNVSFIDPEFEAKMAELAGQPLLVHCASGSRSLRAVTKLKASGKFPEIYHLTSGIMGWEDAGKTIVKTPKAKE